MDNLIESCHNLIAETEAHPPESDGKYDVGFLASFWLYPQAEAFAYVTVYFINLI